VDSALLPLIYLKYAGRIYMLLKISALKNFLCNNFLILN
jgi:hypothetical protein